MTFSEKNKKRTVRKASHVWKKSTIKGTAALLMTAAALTAAFPAFAEETMVYLGGEIHVDSGTEISDTQGESIYAYKNADTDGDYAPVDGGNITDEQLGDKVIEYEELGTFIHKYNTTIKNMRTSSDSTKNQYKTLKAELSTELWDSVKDADDARSDGDSEAYNTYKSYENIYKSAIKGYNSMIDRLNSYGSTQNIKNTEKTLTSAAQELMISYNSLKLSCESAEKACEYYDALYNNTLLKVSAGTAVQLDADNAKARCESARASLTSLEGSLDEVYKSLCIMLGIDENAGYTVADIPDADFFYISSIDKDADMQKAVNNSSSVKSTRHNKSTDTTSKNIKEKTEAANEDNAKIEYNSAYSSLIEAENSLKSAELGLEKTNEDWKNAQNKYRIGMLSKADYLEAELSYLMGVSEYEGSRMQLASAVSSYKWLLEGIG